MATACTNKALLFQGPGRREVRADFNGGDITSDAGVLLLQEVEKRCSIIEQFAHCFDDHRDPRRVEHRDSRRVASSVSVRQSRRASAQHDAEVPAAGYVRADSVAGFRPNIRAKFSGSRSSTLLAGCELTLTSTSAK